MTGSPELAERIAQEVRHRMQYNHGDLDAPLAPGEQVYAVKACSIPGCDWQLPIEWRSPSSIDSTRSRGSVDTERQIAEHLTAEHADQAVVRSRT